MEMHTITDGRNPLFESVLDDQSPAEGNQNQSTPTNGSVEIISRPHNVLYTLFAIQKKHIGYWKQNWDSLLLTFVMVTVALLIIFNFKKGSSGATDHAVAKVSMEKMLDPQVLFVAGTSKNSPEMKYVINLFKKNVERNHGKFIELPQSDLNEGNRKKIEISQ
jgi:hypothetical protein